MPRIFKTAEGETSEGLAEEMRVRQTKQYVLLFSMGSQFDHLIVQKLAKLGVFTVVADPASVTADDVRRAAPAGLILSGGPANVSDARPPFDFEILDIGIPVLGICLGFQMWADHVGAHITPAKKREYGVHTFRVVSEDPLFEGVASETPVLESHG